VALPPLPHTRTPFVLFHHIRTLLLICSPRKGRSFPPPSAPFIQPPVTLAPLPSPFLCPSPSLSGLLPLSLAPSPLPPSLPPFCIANAGMTGMCHVSCVTFTNSTSHLKFTDSIFRALARFVAALNRLILTSDFSY